MASANTPIILVSPALEAPVCTTLGQFLADNGDAIGDAEVPAIHAALFDAGLSYQGGGGAGAPWSIALANPSGRQALLLADLIDEVRASADGVIGALHIAPTDGAREFHRVVLTLDRADFILTPETALALVSALRGEATFPGALVIATMIEGVAHRAASGLMAEA